MDTQFQLCLAQEAGELEPGRSWLDEYKYHLGMVENPLPFGKFKMMHNLLDCILTDDPDGNKPAWDRHVNELCRALGY
jgi:hypothetical protein